VVRSSPRIPPGEVCCEPAAADCAVRSRRSAARRAHRQTTRQHLESFTVELWLEEDNKVHHTHITHVQSQQKGSWADWKEARLVDFFVRHAGLRLPPAELAAPVEPEPAPAPAPMAPAELATPAPWPGGDD
jgi:hypothetical protein